MSSIRIHDLAPAGADLLLDSEGYLNDLTDNELGAVNGQTWSFSLSVSYSWGPSYSGVSVSLSVSYSWP